MLETERADVLVVGAGPAGIAAAIGAARAGADVVLVEEDAVPGGAPVDNFVTMPCGQPRTGVYGEMMAQLEQRFRIPVPAAGPIPPLWDRWFLPSSYLAVLTELLAAESRLRLYCHTRPTAPLVEDVEGRPRVRGAAVHTPRGERHLTAQVTIDATGAGALAAQAGCEEMYGTDNREAFGEPHAPTSGSCRVQPCTWMYITQRIGGGSPIDFRALGLPLGVDPEFGWLGWDYEKGLARSCGIYLTWGGTVPCEDTRDPGQVARAQHDALAKMRPQIEALQAQGFAVHLAPRIGVRETRRIRGECVLAENDLRDGAFPQDTVAVGGWWLDIWGAHLAEEERDVPPYGIPYRALVPRGVDGLLVAGKAISVSHIALSAYRVQPSVSATGQAAGVAAAFCARHACQPRDVDIASVQQQLRGERQGASLPPSARP